jgi:iron complex outermembrane recepter protein
LTTYAGHSEADRAPTASELSCADPTSACLLDAFLVSDPNPKQVVSRTVEAPAPNFDLMPPPRTCGPSPG